MPRHQTTSGPCPVVQNVARHAAARAWKTGRVRVLVEVPTWVLSRKSGWFGAAGPARVTLVRFINRRRSPVVSSLPRRSLPVRRKCRTFAPVPFAVHVPSRAKRQTSKSSVPWLRTKAVTAQVENRISASSCVALLDCVQLAARQFQPVNCAGDIPIRRSLARSPDATDTRHH